MIERIIFGFEIRTDATMPIDVTIERLMAALGCTFRPGDYHGTEAWKANLLGMRVFLYPWRGISDTPIFRMHGMIYSANFFDGPGTEEIHLSTQDLSQGIIDLLEVSGAGKWRLPSDAESEAEIAYGARVDRED